MANKSMIITNKMKDQNLNFSLSRATDVYNDDSRPHNKTILNNSLFSGISMGDKSPRGNKK